jgi:hypothetical protein
MVTDVLPVVGPDGGETDVIAGAAIYVNAPAPVVVPSGVVTFTSTGPAVPGGVTATI